MRQSQLPLGAYRPVEDRAEDIVITELGVNAVWKGSKGRGFLREE